MPPEAPRPAPPGHTGHRQRLRQRFLEGGADALPDYELLELVLFAGIPRKDTKPVARALLKRFGTFADVIAADPLRLAEVPDMGTSAIVALKSVQAAALRLGRVQVLNRPVLSSWDELVKYCSSGMAFEGKEQFRVLLLDKKNALLDDKEVARGTVDHVSVYVREVLSLALEGNASALILVHNHPSGDPTPSAADITMTREIRDAAQKLGITVHDHLVIGRGRHVSFRAQGLL